MPDAGSGYIMQLMAAGDFEGFVAALGSTKDINQRYPLNQDMTLLEHACCVDGDGLQLRELLRRRAVADDLNPSRGCRAIHMAAERLNLAAIGLLLQHSNPNALTLNGDNVLHVLCRQPPGEEVEKCVAEVLQLCRDRPLPLDVNHRNKLGQTPVFLAAERKNEPVVLRLLGHGCSIDSDDVQQGVQTDEDRLTTRQLIQPPRWPEFQHQLPPEGVFTRDLFFLLYFHQEEEFVERLPAEVAANPALLDAHDGTQTLLQVAVENKLQRAVGNLLQLGANPNLTQPSVLTASEVAAYKGFPEVLRLLIAHNASLAQENHLSAMHWLIKGADIQLWTSNSPDSAISTDYKECFDMLLAHKELVNARDNNECTPLHLAVIHHMRDPYFVDKLVDSGALLGLKDKGENTPLDIMTPTELRKFLDRRIEVSDRLNSETHEISEKRAIFDMRFLRYFDNNELERYDCQTLVHISKCSERRIVLTHPLVECFLFIKWNAIKLFYFCFLLIYFIYIVLLVTKVSLDEYLASENSSLGDNVTMDGQNTYDILQISIKILLALFLIINLLLTVFYYAISWDTLYSKKRCILKVLIFIFTVLVLFGIGSDYVLIATENLAIFLASLELVLLLGDHPDFAARVKTLKTVSSIFLKFFAWFSPLLLALALCFVTLFRDSNKSFLLNLRDWFVQSLFMFGRGQKVEKLMESGTNPLNQFLLILFVFFLVLVFSNVLNGLAVKDAIAINDDTKLYVNMSRIELLHHAEMALHKLCAWNEEMESLKKLEETLRLKPFLSNYKIIFVMKKKNKWISKDSSTEFTLENTDIITRAENIKKLENADVQDLLKDLMREKKK